MREHEDRRWGRLGRYEEASEGNRPEELRPRQAEHSWPRERESSYGDRPGSGSPSQPPSAHGRSGSLSWRPEAERRPSARTEGESGQSSIRGEPIGRDRDRRRALGEAEPPGRYESEASQHPPPAGVSGRSGGFRGRGPRGYRRSDERIREDVCEALTEHDELDASDIDVAASASEVTLSGLVDDRRSKRLAEDLAGSCRGVKDVHNQLRISQRLEPTALSASAASGQRSSERPFENGPRSRFS